MAQATVGPEQSLATLVVEFDISSDQTDAAVEAIKRAVSNTVSKQPGFISENLHVSVDGTKLLNYFQWSDKDAIKAFFDNKDVQEKVWAEVGPYSPTPRVYDVVFGVSSD